MLATRNLPPHPFRTVYREGHFVVAPPPQRGKSRKNISECPALQMLAASNARIEESPASPFPYRLQGRPLRSGSAPATRKVPQKKLQEAPKGSQSLTEKLPKAPRGSLRLLEATRAPRSSYSQMITKVAKCSQRLPLAPKGFQRFTKAPKGSQRLPEALVLRELGLSFSYADGGGYKVLALLIDPPGTIIRPEGGWGLPHTFAMICILIKKAKKNAWAIPHSFSYTLVANLPNGIISRNHYWIKRSQFLQVFRFFFFVCCSCCASPKCLKCKVCAGIGPGDYPAQPFAFVW
jgi:hypothetical protein